MALLTKISALTKNSLRKDENVIRIVTRAHATATMLKVVNTEFWALPTEELLEMLNVDVKSTLETFEENTALSVALNRSIDALVKANPELAPQFPNRAPTTTGRKDIVFNQKTGQFEVFVPEPSPVEEPG